MPYFCSATSTANWKRIAPPDNQLERSPRRLHSRATPAAILLPLVRVQHELPLHHRDLVGVFTLLAHRLHLLAADIALLFGIRSSCRAPSLAAQVAVSPRVHVEESAPARSPDSPRPASSTSRRSGQTSFAEAQPSASCSLRKAPAAAVRRGDFPCSAASCATTVASRSCSRAFSA